MEKKVTLCVVVGLVLCALGADRIIVMDATTCYALVGAVAPQR